MESLRFQRPLFVLSRGSGHPATSDSRVGILETIQPCSPLAGVWSAEQSVALTAVVVSLRCSANRRRKPLMMREASGVTTAGEPARKTRRLSGSAATSTEAGSAAKNGWCTLGSPGSVLLRNYGSPSSERVAAYDLDDTLITTSSGAKFAKGAADWRWLHPSVPEKLRQLSAEGFKLVIVSNQKGLGSGRGNEEAFRKKLDAVQESLGAPLLVLAALGDDVARKPRGGLWELMAADWNGGLAPDISNSSFVGDAAGRPAVGKVKKDFSDSDLKFALNLGLRFATPEEHFGLPNNRGKIPEQFEFDPRKLGAHANEQPPALSKDSQELVILVGAPGSGKSSLCSQLSGYSRVNQDTLGTKEKCLKACAEALNSGKSVVVDNQNKDTATRKPYLAAAKAAGIPARAVLMDVPKDLCFHLNCYRALCQTSPEHRAQTVPSMVIHGFYKNMQPPKETEGFKEVIRVTLDSFNAQGSDAELGLLRSFLL